MPIISNFPSHTTGGGLAPSPVSNIEVLSSYQNVYIRWTDPEDTVYDGKTLAKWKGTRLVRKINSAPTSRTDGDVIYDTGTDGSKNEYQTIYFHDANLNETNTYYYRFFPYSTDGYYSMSESNVISVKPESVAPDNVRYISTSVGNQRIWVQWTDPADKNITVTNGDQSQTFTISAWEGTRVICKKGSMPTSFYDIEDAIYFDSIIRNAYASSTYLFDGLDNDSTYYIAFYPYAVGGAINNNANDVDAVANRTSATPYVIYIDSYPKPTTTSFVYNGEDQSPWIDEDGNYTFNDEQMGHADGAGDMVATNAGEYTAVFYPNTGYVWPDGTERDYEVEWEITKATNTIELVEGDTSVSLDTNGGESIIITKSPFDGFIAIEGVDGDYSSIIDIDYDDVSYNYDDNYYYVEIRISATGFETGSVALKIYREESENYTQTEVISVNITVTEAPELPYNAGLENMSWSDISTVCRAGMANGEEGGYFSLGDTKTFSLCSSDITANLVFDCEAEIIGFYHDDLTTTAASSYNDGFVVSDDKRGKAGITFLVKTVMANAAMNTSNTNSGSWGSSTMKTSTIPKYYSAMESEDLDLKNSIVSVNKYTATSGNSATQKTTSSTLFLLSAREVFGDNSYTNYTVEGTQYDAFVNGNKPVKYMYDTSDATAWWLRSPYKGTSQSFAFVTASGSLSGDYAAYEKGLVFAFCV